MHIDQADIDRDLDAQVALLTLLVALHLLAFAETGGWLGTSRAVDANGSWPFMREPATGLLGRVALSSRALPMAMRIAKLYPWLLDFDQMKRAFVDQVRMDSEQYRIIRRACRKALH